MRIPIILSLGLLFASTAIAASNLSVSDSLGDESIQGIDFGLGPSVACHDAAMDIRAVHVVSDDETVRVELLVEDVGSRRAMCPGVRSVERDYLQRDVELRAECDPAHPVVCARVGPSFRFVAASDGFVCAGILLPDGAQSDGCLGTVDFVGSSVVWTAPLHGTFLTPEGDTRTFDARGDTVRVDASAWADYGPTVEGVLVPVLTLSDYLDETPRTTL